MALGRVADSVPQGLKPLSFRREKGQAFRLGLPRCGSSFARMGHPEHGGEESEGQDDASEQSDCFEDCQIVAGVSVTKLRWAGMRSRRSRYLVWTCE